MQRDFLLQLQLSSPFSCMNLVQIEAELAIWDEPIANLNCQIFANGDQKVLFHKDSFEVATEVGIL